MTAESSVIFAPSPTASAGSSPQRLRWELPALVTLLVMTAVLYLWGLSSSGWANPYYSAAAQAGGSDWKAWFFGSLDGASSITVDKPPASMWVMGLSVRLFGLSSWSILVPQALMGVASVGVLFATVRRAYGPVAGLLAAGTLALTPVATLMFRFNNPDALLVLLMVLAAWATLRAVQSGSTWWLVAAGSFVGFAFLTKMLQAFLVLPALGLAYLIAGPPKLLKRLWQLGLAAVSLVVSAGWWVAIVELMPASARPYIGGSQGNSVLELTLRYNGLGRITGEEVGSVGGGQRGPAAGTGGLSRMFDGVIGGQISWLLPAALVLLLVGLALTFRAPRTDLRRAGYIVWGGWLLVTGVIFSTMEGIFHEYYTVALAPAIAALVGMGVAELWPRRHSWPFAAMLAGVTALTAWWAWTLLGRSDWQPWLRPAVLVGGLLAAAALAGAPKLPRRVLTVAAGAAAAAALAGPAAYAVQTASQPHTGAIVTAGPSVQGGNSGPGGGGASNRQDGTRRDGTGTMPGGGAGTTPGAGTGTMPGGGTGTAPNGGTAQGLPGAQGGTAQGGAAQGGAAQGGAAQGGAAQGGAAQGGAAQGGTAQGGTAQGGTAPGGTAPNGGAGQTGGAGQRGGAGGMGGLLNAQTPNAELVALLKTDASNYTWIAAAVGANNAAGYQLATELPVMALGGFNGSDPAPTLDEFKALVAQGKIHYFLGGSGPQANSGSRASQEIAAWVTASFTAQTTGGTTVYDLTKAAS